MHCPDADLAGGLRPLNVLSLFSVCFGFGFGPRLRRELMPTLGRPSGVLAGPGRVTSSRGALRSLATAGALLVVIDGLVGRSRSPGASRSPPCSRSVRRYNGRTFRAIVEARRPRRVDVSGAGPLG